MAPLDFWFSESSLCFPEISRYDMSDLITLEVAYRVIKNPHRR